MSIFYVGFGGALGAIMRYLMSNLINKYYDGAFPIATFIINIMGCFAIGMLVYLFDKHNNLPIQLKLFLITGFCGGYTTFSTFTLEQWQLLQNKMIFQTVMYIMLSIVLGFIFLLLGFAFAKFINKTIY